MLHAAYEAWAADMRAEQTSVVIAATNEEVTGMNLRARRDRIEAGQVAETGVALRDGTRAGVGDWVVTRTNDRRLPVGGCGDFVKNGDTWQVVGHVRLGYATTVHRFQGTTVDTATPSSPRSRRVNLYTLPRAGPGSGPTSTSPPKTSTSPPASIPRPQLLAHGTCSAGRLPSRQPTAPPPN